MNILKQRDVKIKLIKKKLKQWKVALKDSKLLAFKKCFFFQQFQSDLKSMMKTFLVVSFLTIGPEIMSKLAGESESNLRKGW